jgi:peptidoglycan/xylan/chitin deacetylase (PgdA/CDA1 family)
MARLALRSISPSGHRARLSIFIFHRVLDEPDPLFDSAIETSLEFEEILLWLKAWFNVTPLEEAVHGLSGGCLPARAASITFDDGYSDNYHNALPILQRHDLHATFFIATGFLDGGRMWNDTIIESIRRSPLATIDARSIGLTKMNIGTNSEKKAAIQYTIPKLKHLEINSRNKAVETFSELAGAQLPNGLMLSSQELRELHAAGMGIGAHTVSHPILARTDDLVARSEIADSRAVLERLTGDSINLFAYPNGKLDSDYNGTHVSILKELGFSAAVTTNPGASRHGDDIFQLRRFSPWDRQKWKYCVRAISNASRRS